MAPVIVIGNNPRYGGLKYMNMTYNAIAIALTANSSVMSLGRASDWSGVVELGGSGMQRFLAFIWLRWTTCSSPHCQRRLQVTMDTRVVYLRSRLNGRTWWEMFIQCGRMFVCVDTAEGVPVGRVWSGSAVRRYVWWWGWHLHVDVVTPSTCANARQTNPKVLQGYHQAVSIQLSDEDCYHN